MKLDKIFPTASVDKNRVDDYSSKNTRFPAIEIMQEKAGSAKYFIVDGNHRFFAALKRGENEIDTFESTREDGILNKLRRIFGG